MGLTKNSVGKNAVDSELEIRRRSPDDRIIALAGNPNVGKSTLFNNLTGMNQHTGNWPGKTVSNAQGNCESKKHTYTFVDIPGTYSLMAHSAEEEIARNFICFSEPDAVVVVCDATVMERNLNLVLQTLEISSKVLICVNLLDEAKRKNITVDLKAISDKLGVPVVGTVARKKKSLGEFLDCLDNLTDGKTVCTPLHVKYVKPIEDAIAVMEPVVKAKTGEKINSRWLSLKLLDYDESLGRELKKYFGFDVINDREISAALEKAFKILDLAGINSGNIKDKTVACIVLTSEDICNEAVRCSKSAYNDADRKIDKIITGRRIGRPLMIALLALVFWLTISGSNYPSDLIARGLFYIQDKLTELFNFLNAPQWLHGMLVLGVYRVVAWVVSVMLPPMAIFFPLFTLLEDVGYLPRVAYNLDKPFKKCSACGKQALTACMGFGCNAAGVVGCRIIDSPRERLIAVITNSFVPCNGRFPGLTAIITMFFIGTAGAFYKTVVPALILTGIIVFSVLMTLAASKFLSKTFLKGVASSFTLELPPYRRPQIGKVIIRSIFDRTLFVLGRAVSAAAPAGLIIWLMANVTVGSGTLLSACSGFLDPFARLLGLDGIILMAFILGFPANEIVFPIILMGYLAQGTLGNIQDLSAVHSILVQNGWTWITAICTMIFSLMHWPCSTTVLTIKKETGSLKWTAASILLPALCGMIICLLFNFTAKLLS